MQAAMFKTDEGYKSFCDGHCGAFLLIYTHDKSKAETGFNTTGWRLVGDQWRCRECVELKGES